MRTLWLVVKHDVGTVLRQWTFWLFSFIMPVLMLMYLTYDVVRDTGQSAESAPAEAAPQTPAEMPPIGLVDEAGLIARMPPGIPPALFVRYPALATARAALDANQISQYVHIPADYVATGAVAVYTRNFQLSSSSANMGVAYGSAQAWVLEYLLHYNLVGDERLLAALTNPTPGQLVERHVLQPSTTDSSAQPLANYVSTIVPFTFYFLLVLSGSYLLRSVVAEKENRTVEVLLLSLPPRRLMVGKLLAVSVILALQLVIWLATSWLVISRRAEGLRVASFTLPPGFWLWAALFLVLGYLLYASVMAAAGALAPNAREGGQIIWLLIIPLMPTMMFASDFVEQPHGSLALFLSLFPFSAPSAMVTRLAVSAVPLWQIGVSLMGLALTAWLFIEWAGRFFRADTMLSYASFNWRRLLTDWRR